jgi:hypothetical protein
MILPNRTGDGGYLTSHDQAEIETMIISETLSCRSSWGEVVRARDQ